MTPEDVLLEAISLAAHHGDSALLREQSCDKLKHSIEFCGVLYAKDSESSNEHPKG